MNGARLPDASPPSDRTGREWLTRLTESGLAAADVKQTRAQRQASESLPYFATRVHPSRSAGRLSAIPSAYWLAFLGVGCLTLGLACWAVYRQMNAENSLRATERVSTVGSVAAGKQEDPPQPEPQPVRPAQKDDKGPPAPLAELPPVVPLETLPPPPPPPPSKLELPGVELPPLVPPPAATPPPLSPPPPVELPPLVEIPPPVETPRPIVALEPPTPELDLYPLVFTHAADPGDTPMLRNWKMLAAYSLTVVTLSQPVVAGERVDDKKITDRLDKMDEMIRKAFEAIHNDVKSISGEIGTIKKDIDRLKTDGLDHKIRLETLESNVAKLNKRLDDAIRSGALLVDGAGLEELKSKLGGIERAIAGLQPSNPVVAKSPPRNGAAGRVVFMNNYSDFLLLVINGQTVRVAPMTTHTIEGVPAGNITYEVMSPRWGVLARRTTTLAANETFGLTAQP